MKKIVCILGILLINILSLGEKEQPKLKFRIEDKKDNYVLIKIEEREKEVEKDKNKEKKNKEEIKNEIEKAGKIIKKNENKKLDKSKKFIFALPEYYGKEE